MLPIVDACNQHYALYLASNSPRRHEIFRFLGFKFDILKPSFAEDLDKQAFAQDLRGYVRATSAGKLNAIMGENTFPKKPVIIVCCDTVIIDAQKHSIIEKPINYQGAFDMLADLLGRTVSVVSSVNIAVLDDQHRVVGKSAFEEESLIHFYPKEMISDNVIHGYLSDPSVPYDDLTGALSIQGPGMVFVRRVEGCYFNIVGFPMPAFHQRLSELLGQLNK